MSSDPTLPRRKTTQLPSHLLSLLHLLLARPSRPLRLGGEPALAWPSPPHAEGGSRPLCLGREPALPPSAYPPPRDSSMAGRVFLALAGACKFCTVWAGLCLIHHQRTSRQLGVELLPG